MRQEVKYAVLEMYNALDEAERLQAQRGRHDQGARSRTTAGKHLTPLAEVICNDLIAAGYNPDGLYADSGNPSDTSTVVPGWFRASKKWDILAFDDDELLLAVELKSMSSSFGNNVNNRVEEVIGSAIDAKHAIVNSLISNKYAPPALGYLLILPVCDDSEKIRRVYETHYPVDPVFHKTSYADRFEIMCRRMVDERVYQAACFIMADVEAREVYEPSTYLTYDRFIETLISQLRISRA